ncbi:2,3-bisphosphoglycerate-independent phosphoglycerate mutase [Candidatus Pacearchaeota archaeon]|nr:2,3-bisphosphoglycerate-independent phosphoglycerate mutase [Candidatus Pacearchaeota archaeon]
MKGVLVIIDGMGDLPNKQLGNKTPLEAADTPNLDFFAARGELGYMYSVKQGYVPESDQAIVCIFGNELIDSTRGQLEAAGAGVKLMRGDLALRVNFATIDSLKEGNFVDRRVGRNLTNDEAQVLAKAINKIQMPVKFEFVPTIQHRGVLVFRGGFSDNIAGNDAAPQGKPENLPKAKNFKALDDEDNTIYTINLLNEFVKKTHGVLNDHPINQERRKKGFLPANYMILRGAGVELPKLKQYKKWASINYMPLEIGFSKLSGMSVFSFEYPKLKGNDSYENLWEGLKKACEFVVSIIKKKHKDFDYFYVHLKEVDLPGHDNKPLEKKAMLEHIDKTLFAFLREFVQKNEVKVVVTADHSTPCKLKSHSDDPVPVLVYNNSIPKEKKFSESECRKGSLGRIEGRDFLKKVGFAR